MSAKTEISRIPGKKSQKTDHVGHDYISNIPDCVISHILSCLPTKDAVRTSILSKDWEYKWTSICNIEFDDKNIFKNERKKASFVNFVERTLVSQNLQSFRLCCRGSYGLTRMNTWISDVLSRHVHCLQIYCYDATIVLAPKLLSCYSLRKLHLSSVPGTLKVTSKIRFPYLTTLVLDAVVILNEHSSSDPVEFNFPVLETLELRGCKWSNIKFMEIYAPKMTSFKIETPYNAGEDDCSIKITGDNFVSFEFCVLLVGYIVLSGSPVVSAAVSYGDVEDVPLLLEDDGLQIQKLLKGFSSLKELKLSDCMVKAISLPKLGLFLPKYYKMERLILDSFCYTEALLELLHAAPYLKSLVIDVLELNDYDYDAEESVPSCIVSYLGEVTFTCVAGKLHELNLVEFFLKNSVHLKRLSVRPLTSMPKKERYEIMKKLWTCPKASTCSTLEVQGVENEKLNVDY